jgi:hypothetical protein
VHPENVLNPAMMRPTAEDDRLSTAASSVMEAGPIYKKTKKGTGGAGVMSKKK